jgi:hypothetical protein
MKLTYDRAWKLVGGLSTPSKMPGHSWSISAKRCITGAKLHEVEGSVCSKCYALKGNYTFPVVVNAHETRWRALRGRYFVQAFSFLMHCLNERYVRLYDAGDLDSTDTLDKWAQIARNCPDVKFWLPTKEYGIVSNWLKSGNQIPFNLNIRLSGYMINESGPITLAKRLGCTISQVSTGAFNCPSSKQGNKCETCRACWDKETFCVTYKKH